MGALNRVVNMLYNIGGRSWSEARSTSLTLLQVSALSDPIECKNPEILKILDINSDYITEVEDSPVDERKTDLSKAEVEVDMDDVELFPSSSEYDISSSLPSQSEDKCVVPRAEDQEILSSSSASTPPPEAPKKPRKRHPRLKRAKEKGKKNEQARVSRLKKLIVSKEGPLAQSLDLAETAQQAENKATSTWKGFLKVFVPIWAVLVSGNAALVATTGFGVMGYVAGGSVAALMATPVGIPTVILGGSLFLLGTGSYALYKRYKKQRSPPPVAPVVETVNNTVGPVATPRAHVDS